MSLPTNTQSSSIWLRSGSRVESPTEGLRLTCPRRALEAPGSIQLIVVERAFRVLKSELLLRPIWHHYSGRTRAHVMVCVLAYALWKTLDHLARRAGLMTTIRKPDRRRPRSSPKPRRMTPQVILRELTAIKVGDVLMKTTEGQQLVLRRGARPEGEQARILEALKLTMPERLINPVRIL